MLINATERYFHVVQLELAPHSAIRQNSFQIQLEIRPKNLKIAKRRIIIDVACVWDGGRL